MKKAEEAYIAEHYERESTKEIAAALGRTPDYVRYVARSLGLYRREARTGGLRCRDCVMFCNKVCIAHIESGKCSAARFTKAVKWPETKTKFNYFD